MTLSLDEIRKEAVANKQAFGKGRLRDEFRMKPNPNAEPQKWVKNSYNNKKYPVYLVADCVPIKERKINPKTDKQILANKKLAIQAKLRSNKAKAGKIAKEWLESDCLIIDTETTGLTVKDQIIEMAIIDTKGNILFNHRFKPSVVITPEAHAVHGISMNELSMSLSWPDKVEEIKDLLLSKPIIIFNADFDIGMLFSTSHAFGLELDWIEKIDTRCAMYLSADAFGSTNRYGSISLATAAQHAKVDWIGNAHNATNDAMATLSVLEFLSKSLLKLESDLTNLQK